jgi:hypothetical protein
MAALPPSSDLAGSGAIPDSDTFRAAIGNVRAYLSGLFGDTGVVADALTTLGAPASSSLVNYNNTVVTINTGTATLDWNLDNGVLATLLMNGNKTFNLPTNIKNNNYTLIITQSATTAYTISWNAGIDFGLLGAPDISVLNSQTRVDMLAIGGTIRAFWTPYK